MDRHCGCRQQHQHRRIVLTGGPGAGKTAVLELLRHSLCEHAAIVPEAAGIVFGGGFPRRDDDGSRQAAQRAIYHIQRELEEVATASGATIQLCDRGLPDGVAYWVGHGTLWEAVREDCTEAFARYDAVVHLRVPSAGNGYGHQNPLRIESASEARVIDDRILAAWDGHPRGESLSKHRRTSSRRRGWLSKPSGGSCRPAAGVTLTRRHHARRIIMYSRHEEAVGQVAGRVEDVFAFLDDHARLASHMSKRSWMMGGGKMDTVLDDARGRQVGSRIAVRGRVFGLLLSLDERVIERVPPYRKAWETEGEPHLFVVGAYRMGFELSPGVVTGARIWIDYDLPKSGIGRWLGVILGGWYARWCVDRMLGDASTAFDHVR